MSSNIEYEFRKHILLSLDNIKYHEVDIPDELKQAIKLLPQHAELLSKLIKEKPYDLGVLKNGIWCGIELKNVKDALSFNLNKIANHQIKSLEDCVKKGGLGWVLVRIKKGLSSGERKRLNTKFYAINTAFALKIQWISKQIKAKNFSIPIEVLREECITIPFDSLSEKYDLDVLWPTRTTKKKV